MRKTAFHRLRKTIPDFIALNEKEKRFSSEILSNLFNYKKNNVLNCNAEEHKTEWNIETERILIKACRENNCYPAHCYQDSVFKLKSFTLLETPEQFEYLYHSTNVPPEIILKEGIKLRYSFCLIKGFPPLIFLSHIRRWSGDYTYKVKINQKVYFDTNLNHQCRTGNYWFCVKQNITPDKIELVTTFK